MATAGYLDKIYVRTDTTAPTSVDEIDGLNDQTMSRLRELIESTNFKSGGWKNRVAGLQDMSVDLSGQWVAGDAPQGVLRDGLNNGTTVYVTVLVDPSAIAGSQGFRIPMLVAEYAAKAQVSGLNEFTCKLQGNGSPTAV